MAGLESLKPGRHRFKTVTKGGPGRKVRAEQTRKVRVGARNPGGTKQGTIRKPY